jgi:hypothetical protein
VIGLTISWNAIPDILHGEMIYDLKLLTVVFQVCFAIPALFIWESGSNNFFSTVDFLACLVAIPADIRWFRKYDEPAGVLPTIEVFTYCLLAGYMTGRLWMKTVRPGHRAWQHSPDEDGGQVMERLGKLCARFFCNISLSYHSFFSLEVVWVSRSAPLISQIFPEINDLWDQSK